jgi:hypothetical protein
MTSSPKSCALQVNGTMPHFECGSDGLRFAKYRSECGSDGLRFAKYRSECGSDGLRFAKYRSDGLQVSSAGPSHLKYRSGGGLKYRFDVTQSGSKVKCGAELKSNIQPWQERRSSEFMTHAPLGSLNSVGGVAMEMNGMAWSHPCETAWSHPCETAWSHPCETARPKMNRKVRPKNRVQVTPEIGSAGFNLTATDQTSTGSALVFPMGK